VAENLLNQQFQVSEPNKVWLSDITYVPADEGWLYLAGHKDLFTHEIVGYAMGERMTKNLVSYPDGTIGKDAADRKNLGYKTVLQLGRCI
jgi:hypothetical protein